MGCWRARFERAEDRATLDRLMPIVTDREPEVLHMRFAQDITQVEIGAVVGVSQMQVSRVIGRPLERLRTLADGPAQMTPDDEADA
jgi:RNA polymerase sigma-B factor